MKPLHVTASWILFVAFALLSALAEAQEKKEDEKSVSAVYPLAIFPFAERGKEVSELGQKVSDLVFANLVANPELFLVDREDLTKIIQELELSQSALVNPREANRVGYLTGAKILVTGSVLQVGEKMYLIAKVIGTETSRVVGASVKGNVRDDLDELAEQLAETLAETIGKRAGDLVAKPVTREDRIAAIKKAIADGKRPKVYIDIAERHVGQATIDPAAETETMLFFNECGFEVIDPDEGEKSEADLLIIGEGFSEFATRHGNLVSVKARLEVKAVDRLTARVMAIDRHVAVGADLTEQIAGKAALQEAAASIAVRMLPKLATKKQSGKKKKGANKRKSD